MGIGSIPLSANFLATSDEFTTVNSSVDNLLTISSGVLGGATIPIHEA